MGQAKMSEEMARVIATVRTHTVSNYVEGGAETVTLPVHIYEFLFKSLKKTRDFLSAGGEEDGHAGRILELWADGKKMGSVRKPMFSINP
jgi:hypothetical protein